MMNSGNQRSLTCILILVLLPAAILLAGLFLFVTVTWAADAPDGSQPQLHIPDNIPSGPASIVRVSVVLTATNQRVSGVAFPIDFDQHCLTFDFADADGDGIPNGVQFTPQSGFRGSVSLRPDDPAAELIFVLADYSPPIATLETGAVVTMTFTTRCAPAPGSTIYAPVRFAELPRSTFGSPEGRSVAGSVLGGGVKIGATPVVEPTATPAASPTAIPTGTAPTPTPTATPTATLMPSPTPTATPSPTATAVVGGNAAPETRFDPAGVLQGEPVTIDALANDYDLDGDPLTIRSVSQPASGTAAVVAGKLVYTPATTYAGFESFTYIVRDPYDSPGLGRVGVVVSSVRNHGLAPAILVANNSHAVTASVGIDPAVVELTLPPHAYPGLLAGDEVFYLAYLNWQRPAANINVVGDGLRYLARGFTLQAYVNERSASDITLAQPLQLIWRYSAAEAAGMGEQALTLLRWDAIAGAWNTAGIGMGERNFQDQHVTFTVTLPGEYAFFGRTLAPFMRYLPLVQQGADDTGGTVSRSLYLPLISHNSDLWEGASELDNILSRMGEPEQ